MSFLFGKPQAPQTVYLPAPAPVAVSPVAPPSPQAAAADQSAADKAATANAQAQRDQAAASVTADAMAGGRSSNIVAGMRIASEQQASRGLMSQRKRAAATELG